MTMGMANIPTIKMMMTGGWFMALFQPHYHLVGGFNPSRKICKSVGMTIPNIWKIMKNKDVANHQPVIVYWYHITISMAQLHQSFHSCHRAATSFITASISASPLKSFNLRLTRVAMDFMGIHGVLQGLMFFSFFFFRNFKGYYGSYIGNSIG